MRFGRRLREHVSCPIIFLTARVEDVDQLDGFAAGADDYVLKPFSLEVLGRRVAAHMAREGRARGGKSGNAARFFSELTIDYAQRVVEVHGANGGGSHTRRMTRSRRPSTSPNLSSTSSPC